MNNWYPAHNPAVAFSIGNWEIHTYALTMLSGFIISICSVLFFWIRRKYPIEILEIMIIVIVPTSIIGARLGYVLGNLNSEVVRANWYAFWEGGLAIQWGVMVSGFSGLGVVLYYRRQVDWMDCVGIILPAVLAGQAIGRWGNFANHEVFGRTTSYGSVSWLGSWISGNMYIDTGDGTGPHYRVPLFFYEFLTSTIGYVLLLWVAQFWIVGKHLKPGTTGGAYIVWYGCIRIIMEPFRDPSDIMKWGALDASIFFSAIYIIGGVIAILYFQFWTQRYTYLNNMWVLKTPIFVNNSSNSNNNEKPKENGIPKYDY